MNALLSAIGRTLGGRAALLAALCALTTLSASAPATAQEAGVRWGPNPPASVDGPRVDDLFWLITSHVGLAFLIVFVMLIIPVFRDRARPGHKASYDHGTSLRDKRFTAIVAVTIFLVLDAWVLIVTMKDLREAVWNIPADLERVHRVEVLAQQWAWNFRTPGVDNEFGTPDDIVTINHLTVPEDVPVVLHMSSKDVIHSFFVPDMRVKRDANPGAVNRTWFQPAPGSAGDYDILCAELCGYAHYQMQGRLTVVPSEDWDAWQQEASRIALATYDENDLEARWAWDWKE